jgi:hypothetical protein
MLHDYVPPRSDLKLHLYIAQDRLRSTDDELPPSEAGLYLGWSSVVSTDQIIATRIPGDHHSILEKDGALAAALNRELCAEA